LGFLPIAPIATRSEIGIRPHGGPLTEHAVSFIIKEAAKRAGVNPAASIHWLSHAHAPRAVDNGVALTLVSATSGHADLKTTIAHATKGAVNAI
jgi:site-specific recombinase XerD